LAGAVANRSVGVETGAEACPEPDASFPKGEGFWADALAQAERNAARQRIVKI
jgi:hypothetical protein